MARDWGDVEAVRAAIHERMDRYGLNIASVPYSEYRERQGNKLVWVMDIHVKVRGVTEFELHAEGATPAEVLRRIYLAFNNEPGLLSRAAAGNKGFGVIV